MKKDNYDSHRWKTLVQEMNDEVNDNGWKDSLHGTSYAPNNKVALRLPHGESKQQLDLLHSREEDAEERETYSLPWRQLVLEED